MTYEEKEEVLRQLDKDLATVSMSMLTLILDAFCERDIEIAIICAKIGSAKAVIKNVIHDIEDILKRLEADKDD